LALELADSLEFVAGILGRPETRLGSENRKAAVRLQRLDFIFIPLYAAFFTGVALELGSWAAALSAIVCVGLAAVFDFAEDHEILRMVKGVEGSSARRFGRLKWSFYFATLAAEGALCFGRAATPGSTIRAALGIFLIAIALVGVISAVKVSFKGIAAATILSLLGLIGLAGAPWIALAIVPI
jgi:hypothetical protein